MRRRSVLFATAIIAASLRPALAQIPDLSQLYNIAILAGRQQWDQMVALLRDGRSPDATDDSGETAIGYAAHFGNLEMVQTLIYFKAQVDIHDQFGNTPLYWAAERGSTDIMQALLDAKAKVDAVNKQGITPLMTAAGHGQMMAVRLLLKHGADPHKTDLTGRDAFGWAQDEPNVLQFLRRAASG